MTPLRAALSSKLTAWRDISSASSRRPSAINCRVFLTYVRAEERKKLLCSRRRSEERIRFFADFMLANSYFLHNTLSNRRCLGVRAEE